MQDSLLDGKEGFSSYEDIEKENKEAMLFFFLGNASLLAFNIVINAIDIFCKLTGNGNMGTILNRAYNIPCSITALLLCFIKPKNLKVTLIAGLSAVIVLLSVLPIFVLVKMSQNATFWGVVIVIGSIAVFSSVIFSASFSFAAQFCPRSVPYVSSGNGLCGVIAAVLRIITKSIKDTPVLYSMYFFFAAAIYLATLVFFWIKARNPAIDEKLKLKPSGNASASSNTKKVISAIWPQWISVFINFCITLSIFPGYLVGVKPSPKLSDWTPVIITTIFCIFDWVGRAIPSYLPPFPSLKFAWIPILARVLFYPIFMLSIQRTVNLGDPWWTFAWDIVFAITNGYSGTVCMIYGNGHPALTNPEDLQLAGFLMPFAVNAGILAAMALTLAIPNPPA